LKGTISEVFDSVQGEGIYLGEKQLFVRFYGCNLQCKFCDTKLNSFVEYEPQELLSQIKLYRDKYHSISFTGGEPLVQKDFLREILRLTRKDGFINYLETNGTLSDALEDTIDDLDIISMDLKLPSSTGMGGYWSEHRRFLEVAKKKEVFLKAVITQTTQEEDLIEALKLIKEINKLLVLVLQPDSCENYAKIKEKVMKYKEICLKYNITTCIIPQVHKLMGIK
jgi:organic radical activating enzyme